MELEYKSVSFKKLDSEEWSFKGLASTYGNTDLKGDIMMPGCFTERLRQNKQVKMMIDHDYDFENLVGMADLEDSAEGLIISMSFDKEDPLHQKVYRRLKDGSLDSLSIGFWKPSEENIKYGDGVRYIYKADLFEVSFVFIPANPKAKITEVKSFDTLKEAESILREVGFSRTASKAFISQIKKASNQPCDAVPEEETKSDIESLLVQKLSNFTEELKCQIYLSKISMKA